MLQAAADAPDQPADLQPLDDHAPPSMPAQDWLRGLYARAKESFKKGDDPPFLADDKLKAPAPTDGGHDGDRPPTCGGLLGQLEASLGDWAEGRGAAAALQLVVVPPCDERGVLEAWARRRELSMPDPPGRDELLEADLGPPAEVSGDGPLVIPRLECWFLRHRRGLARVRGLLEALATTERRVLVGCNAWAWAFLRKAMDAQAILPPPRTFRALDGPRLQTWLAEAGGDEHFRLSKTGKTLRLDDPDDEDTADFFKTLAAQSRGVPWVAWQMWRDMLRTKAQADNDGGEAEPDDPTLWVSKPEPLKVPNRHEPDELLVLQTLLIHGPLTLGEVDATVPTMNVSGIAQSLKQAGAVVRREGKVRVRPAAYPAARTSLSDAGFPMGEV